MIGWRAPEKWLIAFAVAILGAMGWAWLGQARAVPEVMRYVPVHNDGFFVTAPLNDFWRGFAPHLAPFFKKLSEGEEAGFLRTQAVNLRGELKDKKIQLADYEDLDALGIDGTRSAVLAFVPRHDESVEVMVIPISDERAFIHTVDLWTRKDPPHEPVKDGRLTKVEQYFVGFTADRYAVVGTYSDVVTSLLNTRLDREAQVASNDRLVRLFATPLPRASRAWFRGQLRQSSTSAPGGIVDLVVSADEWALGVDSHVDLPASRSALFRALLQADPAYAEDPAMPRALAAASVAGPELPELLRHMSVTGWDDGDLGLGRAFDPVLEHLSQDTRFSRGTMVLSDASSPEPGLALGLRMTSQDADALVFRLQSALRLERDTQIVTGAVRALTYDEQKAATIATLRQAGKLLPEHEALWTRYTWDGHTLTSKPALTPSDFDNSDYRRRVGNDRLVYVMPPFTDNDLRHRFAADADKLRVADLKAGRFRLCSVYHQGVLWIGTDAPVLTQWLAKLRKPEDDRDYRQAREDAGELGGMRVRLVAHPRHILEAARVNSDGDVAEWADEWLSDLSAYGITHAGVSPDPQRKEWHVRAIFIR